MWCVCFITFGCQKLFSSLQDQIYMIYSNGAQQNLYCCKITRVLKPKFHNKLDPTAWTNSFKLLLWKGLTLPSSKPHGSATRWDKFNRKNIHELHSISFGMLPIATHTLRALLAQLRLPQVSPCTQGFCDTTEYLPFPCAYCSLHTYIKHPISTPQPNPTNYALL